MYKKFIIFSVVGAIGFVIDFSITWLCLTGIGLGEYLSNALGFSVAATTNYILNRRWTFKSQNPNVRGEFLKFLLVSVLGLGVNNLVLMGYMELVGRSVTLVGVTFSDFWVAKVLATGVVLFWNFFINSVFTFKNSNRH